MSPLKGTLAKPSSGMTLLETVLAVTISAIFLAAFMSIFRVEQANFKSAEDEAQLPALGQSILGQIFGASGFLYATTSVQADDLYLPGGVQMEDHSTGLARALAFTPDSNNPPGCTSQVPQDCLGTVTVQDQGGTATPLAPPDSIATMSFYMPDLVTESGLITSPMTNLSAAITAPAGSFTVNSLAGISAGATLSIDDGPGAEVVHVTGTSGTNTVNVSPDVLLNHPNNAIVGVPALYILGATVDSGDLLPNTTLTMAFSRTSTGLWQFWYPSSTLVEQTTFAPGAIFTLNGEGSHDGSLICAFPTTEATQSGTFSVPPTGFFSMNQLTSATRIGAWIQVAGAPESGQQILRDEVYLRD